jgi:hypothetical protein
MEEIVGRWAKGAERVNALIEARHLQQVVGDPDTVTALLASARRHVASATDSARAGIRGYAPDITPSRLR